MCHHLGPNVAGLGTNLSTKITPYLNVFASHKTKHFHYNKTKGSILGKTS